MYTVEKILTRNGRKWTTNYSPTAKVQTLLWDHDENLVTIKDDQGVKSMFRLEDQPSAWTYSKYSTVSDYMTEFFPDNVLLTNVVYDFDNVNKLKYSDVFDYGFSVYRGTYSENPDIEIEHTGNDLRLISNKPHLNDFSQLYNRLVFLLSGRAVNHEFVENNIYIRGGYTELNHFSDRHISLLDFEALGGFTKVNLGDLPISTFITSSTETTVSITLPEVYDGKSIILVLDGRIHLFDGTYHIDKDKLVFSRKHVKLLELNDWRDATLLPWVSPGKSPNLGYDISTVNLPLMIQNTASFILVLDKKNIYTRSEPLLPVGSKEKFLHYREPSGILYLEDGTVGDYRVSERGDGEVEVTTTIANSLESIQSTIPESEQTVMFSGKNPARIDRTYRNLIDVFNFREY